MCGRYAASRRPQDLVEEFAIDFVSGEGPGEDLTAPPDGAAGSRAPGEPNYNVAPTAVAPVVLERLHRPVDQRPDGDASGAGEGSDAETSGTEVAGSEGSGPADVADDVSPAAVRLLRGLTWGLVPSWAKDRSGGARMINARAENLLERPAYRRAARTRRCLVPIDGWYEWQTSPTERDAKGKPRKQPFYMRSAEGGGLALAGIYELWRDEEKHPDDPGSWLATYAVITTEAEPGLDVIHDRMPFVMPPERWSAWLDPATRDDDAVRDLLVAPEPSRFVATPVSTRVNAVRNNGPDLLDPVPLEDLRGVVDPATGELIGAGDVPLF